MKRLKDIETDEYSLEVYECKCGFHIGLDATYIEAVDTVYTKCPNCGEEIQSDVNELEGI